MQRGTHSLTTADELDTELKTDFFLLFGRGISQKWSRLEQLQQLRLSRWTLVLKTKLSRGFSNPPMTGKMAVSHLTDIDIDINF